MKTTLLRVDEDVEAFAPLVEAIAAAGMRWGWLDLADRATPPAALESAARLGVLRAVSAVGERVVTAKPVRGAPVLRDLLREHFSGCRVVLVRGEVEAPGLGAAGEGSWRVVGREGDGEVLSTLELVARLRRPGWPSS